LPSYSRLLKLRQLTRALANSTLPSPPGIASRALHTTSLRSEARFGDAVGDKFAYMTSESDCYKEMPGKSTFTFLNNDKQNFLIDAYSSQGFRINQGDAFIVGPIVAFNSAILSWKVKSIFDINERSLALFTILDPFPELVLIGYGSPLVSLTRASRFDAYEDDEEEEKRYQERVKEQNYIKAANEHMAKVTLAAKAKGLNVSFLSTENAIATYNYLVSEDRLVACAAIPPLKVKVATGDEYNERAINVHDALEAGENWSGISLKPTKGEKTGRATFEREVS